MTVYNYDPVCLMWEQNAPREGAHVDTNATTVQPFGIDPSIVKAAQRANQKLARGEMAGTDNPFVSHRSGAMDKVQLKNQEWAVNHEYVTDTGDGMADTEAADEAAYLASLSKKVSHSQPGTRSFHQQFGL
jgi:hypothetical protein